MKTKIGKLLRKRKSEEATGIEEKGSLIFWSEGEKIGQKEARKNINENKEVAVPGAGAGSYSEVFEARLRKLKQEVVQGIGRLQ